MQRERARALLRRLAGLGLLVAGLLFLAVGVWYRWFGVVPEAELRAVTGPATEVRVEAWRNSRQKGELLSFRVGEQRVSYPSARPGYRQLLAAAQAGAPITVALGPIGLPFGLRSHALETYAISLADQPISTYADKAADEQRGSTSAIVFGGALWAVAFLLLRRRRAEFRP